MSVVTLCCAGNTDETQETDELENEEEDDEFDPSQSDLMTHMQRVLNRCYVTCQPKQPQKVGKIATLGMNTI